MRQFATWTNNLEKEPFKHDEERVVIQKVEYRNVDRLEKSIATVAFKTNMDVTKDYFQRKNEFKSFGIGTSFEDLKTNSAITTVQRENVWHPYYETIIDEMDFKEKMIAAAQEKKNENVGGNAVSELQKALQAHDEGVKLADQEKKRADLGLAPKRVFNIKDKMKEMKMREEEEGEKKVIDPVTIKIRKFPNDLGEAELQAII